MSSGPRERRSGVTSTRIESWGHSRWVSRRGNGDAWEFGAARAAAIAAAAVAAGAVVIALELASDHREAKAVWAVFGPAVGWSFVGTGLYAWRRRPASRTGALMVLLGFAWFVPGLNFADSSLVYTFAAIAGGLWGAIFLHLVVSFPSGRLE